jgi:hypothetical protein
VKVELEVHGKMEVGIGMEVEECAQMRMAYAEME